MKIRNFLVLVTLFLAAATHAAVVVISTPTTQAVEFDGTGNVNYDRATVSVDGGEAANIGGGDFTWEMWLKPTSANNNTGSTFADANIFADRDNFQGATGGEYIFSILNDTLHVSLSPTTGSLSYDEFEATTAINDNQWHFIAITYDFSTGDVQAYIDGTREINGTASNSGTLAYVSGGSAGDLILELGGEKHEAGADLGYFGRISETRISDTIRYSGTTHTVPTAQMTDDADTIVLWRFDEGSGTIVENSAGADSDLTLILNSGSAPPRWVNDSPY